MAKSAHRRSRPPLEPRESAADTIARDAHLTHPVPATRPVPVFKATAGAPELHHAVRNMRPPKQRTPVRPVPDARYTRPQSPAQLATSQANRPVLPDRRPQVSRDPATVLSPSQRVLPDTRTGLVYEPQHDRLQADSPLSRSPPHKRKPARLPEGGCSQGRFRDSSFSAQKANPCLLTPPRDPSIPFPSEGVSDSAAVSQQPWFDTLLRALVQAIKPALSDSGREPVAVSFPLKRKRGVSPVDPPPRPRLSPRKSLGKVPTPPQTFSPSPAEEEYPSSGESVEQEDFPVAPMEEVYPPSERSPRLEVEKDLPPSLLESLPVPIPSPSASLIMSPILSPPSVPVTPLPTSREVSPDTIASLESKFEKKFHVSAYTTVTSSVDPLVRQQDSTKHHWKGVSFGDQLSTESSDSTPVRRQTADFDSVVEQPILSSSRSVTRQTVEPFPSTSHATDNCSGATPPVSIVSKSTTPVASTSTLKEESLVPLLRQLQEQMNWMKENKQGMKNNELNQ
ncbi:uncharacterized protein [Palaemon carinicauda]|uniref:uncharacterized protein n=1 Tax=Palaemon carinicauda TaxID=392227 RepID=UPI0035B5B3FD